MSHLDAHPSVIRFRQHGARPHSSMIDATRLRELCLDAGAACGRSSAARSA